MVGALSPGYDATTRTVSRLAVPGMPAAAAVDVSIALVALACLAVAFAMEPGALIGRIAVATAGAAFIGAATIHLDPASAPTTAAHRVASGLALLGLTVAPLILARTYGRALLLVAATELVLLVIGLALLTTSFIAWGVWERCMLGAALTGVVILSARLPTSATSSVSAQAIVSASRASVSSGGSYAPVRRVIKAKP